MRIEIIRDSDLEQKFQALENGGASATGDAGHDNTQQSSHKQSQVEQPERGLTRTRAQEGGRKEQKHQARGKENTVQTQFRVKPISERCEKTGQNCSPGAPLPVPSGCLRKKMRAAAGEESCRPAPNQIRVELASCEILM